MNFKGKNSFFFSALATILTLALALGSMQAHAQDPLQTEQKNKRPNILLIVAGPGLLGPGKLRRRDQHTGFR